MSRLKYSFLLLLSLLSYFTSAQVVVMDDSLYDSAVKVQMDVGPSVTNTKSVMERETIQRQLRMYLYKRGVNFSEVEQDQTLWLSVFRTEHNKVEAITYNFMKAEFIDRRYVNITYDLAERDSLANLLNLKNCCQDLEKS